MKIRKAVNTLQEDKRSSMVLFRTFLLILLFSAPFSALHSTCAVTWSSSASWNGLNWGVGGTRYTVNSTVKYGPNGNEYRVKAIPGFNCNPTNSTYAHYYWTNLGSCSSAPTVGSTTSISSTTCSAASSGGSSLSDGGSAITSKGVCWNTSSNPTTSNSKTSNGSGTGSFSASITSLSAGTTYYVRAYATNSIGTSYGPQRTFTTLSATSAGSIGSTQSICYNSTPASLTQSGAAGGGSGSYTYQWQSSSNNSSWSSIGGATSTTYSPGPLTSSTYYRRQATSSNCGTSNSSSILVTVYGNLTAGTIGSAQSICYNTTPSGLTNISSPSGGTGSYTYQWQSSSNNSSWSNIGGATSSTYNPGALTSNTYYRRAETSGSCGTVYTPSILITVYNSLSAGSIGSAQTICYNGTPSGLTNSNTPTGGTGSYTYQWQSSSDNSSWSDIGGATSITYNPGALTSTTYFRRSETSGSCGTVYSSSIMITVYGNLAAGSVGSAQSICYNTTPSSLTNSSAPSGGTGSYSYQWQISSDNSSWSDIGGATSTTYSPGALTTNTYYRRAESSGSCGTVYTSSVLIEVYNNLSAGTVGSSQSICQGGTPAGLTNISSPSGGTGAYNYQWQNSSDNSTWSDIGGATNSTYSPGALATNTYYRREETAGSCGTVYSPSVLISVSPTSVGGSISSAATVCTGSNGATLALSGSTGNITKWQYSTDNWTTPVDIANTTATQAYNNLTTTTKYRAVVQSGGCAAVYSSEVEITVTPALNPGVIKFQ